jgi:putative ATP-binding cassette transporter
LTQSASAFTTMQGAMSWFVDAYGRIAEWTATIERLIRFDRAIAAVRADRVQSTIRLSTEPHSGLLVEQLDLALPDGRLLIKGASIGITPGEAVLLTGPPGSGKSTLLRAIAGIWPYGRGRIVQPARARLLFVPQRPYVPIGRLREVVSYPDSPTAFSEEQICAALTACGLAALCSRLEESANWGQQLSPGEQQRIAFARALLLEPDWLFLDNAASALHAGDETQLYRLLKERLPQVTLFYVSHRPALAGSRGRWIEVCRDASGPGWLEEPGLEPHAVPLRRGAAAL